MQRRQVKYTILVLVKLKEGQRKKMALENKSKYTTIEVDIRLLPKLWWSLLREAVNDYLQFKETHPRYKNAAKWLFISEEETKELDVIHFHIVAQAFNIDKDKFRFSLQRLKDKKEENKKRDSRGRKSGFLSDPRIEVLVDLSQIGIDVGYNFV